MIQFKVIEIDDRKWMDPIIFAGNMRGSEHGFVTPFIWAKVYHSFVAKINNYLIVKSGDYYLYPCGSGDIQPVIELMIDNSNELGIPFCIAGVTRENQAELDILFPNKFKYTEDRGSFDYIYSGKSLSTLAGSKLRAKRNHINHFIKNNPDWKFESITKDNIDECKKMSDEWFRITESSYSESIVVESCFSNYQELGLAGGLIRISDTIVAFTIGSQLSSDTFDIHVEKAFSDIQGTYPMINHQFVKYILEKYPNILYFNREEDLGNEGLRKSKLSYYPEILLEKCICELK